MFRSTRGLRAAAAGSWSQTLHLPKSTFPARPSSEELLKYRKQCADDYYAWQKENAPTENEEGERNTFTLHDGPPYANGPVHVGHALNKINKDIILRTYAKRGFRVQYRPGWDCHGLPIELKALQAHQQSTLSKESTSTVDEAKQEASVAHGAGLSPLAIREAARKLATKTIAEQMSAFRSWGVMGEWEKPYKTMDADFEIKQLQVFKDMVAKGLIYRQNKPVHWSPSSGTALAEAELEYDEDHRVVAAFVKFPLLKLPPVLADNAAVQADFVSALIWTTTPWTLPANKAIAVRSDMYYVLLEVAGENVPKDMQGQMVVAKERVESLQTHLPEGATINILVDNISGANLENTEYINVISAEHNKIIHADFVTDNSGTGLVHIAPGHGMDDYNVCMKLGIGPAFAPVDDHGKYTNKAFPSDPDYLQGLPVEKDGAKAVVALLRDPHAKLSIPSLKSDSSLVFKTHNLRHKNPVDWRTKQPVITRATDQWFANVGSVQESALKAVQDIMFIPDTGKPRLQSFLKGRSQWCISRQRSWGVPIPALFHKQTGEPVLTVESIEHIIRVIQKRGTDAWWADASDDPAWIAPGLDRQSYVRGKDTMDVWFDSGTSWAQLEKREDGSVADMIFEGSDQHRGWFQSLLLTYLSGQTDTANPPVGAIVTHGFTLDHTGRKMSKSLGNVISPEEIISGTIVPPAKTKKGTKTAPRPNQAKKDAMGPDALRLWVASSDYTKDVVIGQPVLQAVHSSLHKYRTTFKWLLGIMHDYPAPIPVEDLLQDLYFADQVALHQLSKTSAQVWEHYGAYEFHKGVQAINKFINADLSGFYFEVIKDRLYADDENVRRHTQTVLFIIMEELCHMLGPITPHLIEEVWQHIPEQWHDYDPTPISRRPWEFPFTAQFDAFAAEGAMEKVIKVFTNVSTAVKSAQENARRAGRLGSSLACRVELQMPRETGNIPLALLLDLRKTDELTELFVVSDADVVPGDPEYRRQLAEQEPDEELRAFLLKADEPAWKFECEFECGDPKFPATGKAVVLPPHGQKCIRCWQFTSAEADSLCGRCTEVVGEEAGIDDQMIEEEYDELAKYR
ncbi:isoleucyl-tRNA synthetase [Aureobasidium subglaciale]|nr:isoleucyl-tRNA synthetase [Aureobasidium subglaciale]